MALTKINTNLIAVNTIAVSNIADNAIDATKIAQNSILTRHIDDGQVTTSQLGADAVTGAKIADDAIDSEHYTDGSIDTAHIADNQVTLAKMAGITRGSIIIGNSSGDPAALAIGTNDYVLTSDGTDIAWEAASSFNADAAQVFNESGADVDFRVESNNNANMLFVDGGSDNVGIGTSSPTALSNYASVCANDSSGSMFELMVGGTRTANIQTGSSETHIQTRTNIPMIFDTNNTEAMRITNAQKVGIGTTSPANLLHVYGNDNQISIDGATGANSALFLRENGTNKWELYHRGASDDFRIYNYANSSFDFTITSAGLVGLGTTSPGYGLVVNNTGNSILQIKSGDTSWGSLYFGEQSNAYRGIIQYNHNDDNMEFYTAGAERMNIMSDGDVRIGTTAVVYGGLEELSFLYSDFGFGMRGTGTAMGLWNSGSSGTYIAFAYGGGGAAAGSITFSTTTMTYGSASDYRLKENIDYDWDATTRLKQLKPARFNWIEDDTNTLQDGFLAHEVQSVVPEAVVGTKDQVYTAEEAANAPNTSEGDIKTQEMDSAKLVPLLVKTIQELEARITTLEG